MAKITLGKLKLEKNTNISTFVFNEQEVEVLSYLPLSDKIDLISIAIQDSLTDGRINRVKLDALLHLYIVYSYTNINFTPTQKENYMETYDLLEKNGFITELVNAMPKEEYADIIEKCFDEVSVMEDHGNSIVGLIKNFVSMLPDAISNLNDTLGEVDDARITDLLDIVKEHGAN